jgi:acyl-CoA thioester hydrolase
MLSSEIPVPEFVRDLLKDYKHPVAVPVLWGDMDALQHVNNLRYFRYFESARVTWFELNRFTGPALSGRVGPILSATSCRFKAPVTYPDTVWTATRVKLVESDRFVLEHATVSEKLGRVVAIGEAEVVSYDYELKRKADLPSEWREVLSR